MIPVAYFRLFFLLFPLVLAGLIHLLFVRPMRLGGRGRVVAALALLLGACKFAVFYSIGGDTFNPTLPGWVMWFLGWTDAALMTLSLTILPGIVWDIGQFVWCGRSTRPHTRRVRGAWVVAFTLVASAWGIFESARPPAVRTHEIAFANLPAAFDGYRIVHLSDLHASTTARRGRFEDVVRRTNALAPDLIAITGDFVDGRPCARADDLEPLADLRAKDGVFACSGNHENYSRFEFWYPYFRRWGIRFPDDGSVCIRRGGATLAIGSSPDEGVVKQWKRALAQAKDEDEAKAVVEAFGSIPDWAVDLTRLFAGTPKEAFRILLRHRPVELARAAKAGVSLQLSGHTHGGVMPILASLVARHNGGHVRGLYREDGVALYVSPGTCQWAGFLLRYFNPTEIALIVLRREES